MGAVRPDAGPAGALFTLERDWGDAEGQAGCRCAAAAAALAVESARATAEHNVRAAAADLAAKKADWRRLTAENGTPLAVESERAKAAHADTAAQPTSRRRSPTGL